MATQNEFKRKINEKNLQSKQRETGNIFLFKLKHKEWNKMYQNK